MLDLVANPMTELNDEWVWWKHGVIYHVYPLSFYDSNNDGKGDLRGIIQKLGYLQNLGIDAIWLSPIFKSPMAEFGYDVSDYYDIDPVFGNINDFKDLLYEAHSRNIRVILDIVLNHTSDKHPWFIESKSGKDHLKRNWYIWQPAKKGKPPTNWKTAFGGSCWELDKTTGEYYLHSFLKEQPDLNWRNKEVRNQMTDMLRFWLEMGVDGFRFDVINFIVKDKKLRNNPAFFWLPFSQKIRTRNHPKSYKIIRSLRQLLDSYPEKTSVGEIYALPPGDPKLAASYLINGDNLLHLTFDFSVFFVFWNARKYFKIIERWQNSIPDEGWPTIVFSNHDLYRAINRFLTGRNQEKKARLLALLLMTLRGTPFIYYGEELGMKNGKIPRSRLMDPLGKKFWPFYKGRDRCRTPMQWDNSPNAGFSQHEPWLPVNNDYPEKNVEKQGVNPESILNLYRELIRLRRSVSSLQNGNWTPGCNGKNGVISYFRKSNNENVLVVVNFSCFRKIYPQVLHPGDELLFSTYPNPDILSSQKSIQLQAYEGIVVKLNSNEH